MMSEKKYPIPDDLLKEFDELRKFRIFRNLILKFGTYRRAKKASFEWTEKTDRAFEKVYSLYPELRGTGVSFNHVDNVLVVPDQEEP